MNGVELQYVQSGGGNPSGNSEWNTGSQVHTIGANQGNTSRYYDGMMSQCYFVDGQTLGPGFLDLMIHLQELGVQRNWQGDPTVNDGTTWSSIVTATGSGAVSGINGSYPVTGAFDTNSGTYLSTSAADISSNPAILTVTFPAGKEPSFSSDVVVYVGGSTSDTIKNLF